MSILTSMSVAMFKEQHNTATLDVVRNPNTQKLFISANGKPVAAVAEKYDPSKPKQFCHIQDDDTKKQLWVLCNAGADNVVETL